MTSIAQLFSLTPAETDPQFLAFTVAVYALVLVLVVLNLVFVAPPLVRDSHTWCRRSLGTPTPKVISIDAKREERARERAADAHYRLALDTAARIGAPWPPQVPAILRQEGRQ